jgi:multisubunit Na+/H+ antiporter MnhB subunit
VLLAGLTTGHKVGLAVVAAAFIAFALASSFVAPRRRPDFPGRAGLSVFVLVSLAFFVAMLAAVIVFGAEGK